MDDLKSVLVKLLTVKPNDGLGTLRLLGSTAPSAPFLHQFPHADSIFIENFFENRLVLPNLIT